MFESIEIRKASNGFILVIHNEDEDQELIYDSSRKLMRAVKKLIDGPSASDSED